MSQHPDLPKNRMRSCPLCGSVMLQMAIEDRLTHIRCPECEHHHNELDINCTICGKDYTYFGGYAECPDCTHTEDFEEVTALLSGRREFSTICFSCRRKGTVIRYGSTFVCVGCLDWSKAD